MNKFLTYLILSSLVTLISLPVSAIETVACSHPEVCRLLKIITDDKLKTETLVLLNGDPHEFEPSALEIKKLIAAKVLVTGPVELNPWIKKILYQRAKDKSLKTFTLELDESIAKKYGNNKESLSHFWLYPEMYCHLKNKLSSWDYLKENSMATKAICDFQKTNKMIEAKLQKINLPIILTHDALLPLLNFHAHQGIKLISLRGSGHHEEVSPMAIKAMYDALKNPKVIWIIENNIHINANITNRFRSTDHIIKIDTGKNEVTNPNDEFPTLTKIFSELAP